jgi:hypothetical protein
LKEDVAAVEQYAGVLYLVPVLVAAVVAFVMTRPARARRSAPSGPARRRGDSAFDARPEAEFTAPVIPLAPSPRKTGYTGVERRTGSRRPQVPAAPSSLMHAALSSHITAVSRATGVTKAAASASRAAGLAAHQNARLVSIRRPARIPRRPSHLCPRKFQ